ncbi:MAG: mannonate dehydratase, partial [Chitinophagaceae bacterium]
YWEILEPKEGTFDFTLVDSLVASARLYNLKLVLLWFGAWKNSMSCYAPEWVKTNQARFPRAVNRAGKGLEILSAFSSNNLEADSRAFSALMKHLRETDREETVIMVQVENEIGMLTEAREYTEEANRLFTAEVPKELLSYLTKNRDLLVPELAGHWSGNGFRTKGNWETVFGKSLATDELFQSWYYAQYTNAIATAGSQQYKLPMFVNAALNHRHVEPGKYPSAGPLPHLMDIWQAAAPALDFLSPDFYNPDFKYYNDLYTRRSNPLFIPEIRLEPSDGAKALYAVGHYHAIGFSPFSIESAADPAEETITKAYALLSQLSPLVLKHQGTAAMQGVLLDSIHPVDSLVMGDYKLVVSHEYTLGWSPDSKKPDWPSTAALIIEESPGNFVIAGSGIVVTFSVKGRTDRTAGILRAHEGRFVNGRWQPGRWMNGDQDHQGRHIRFAVNDWGIQKAALYQYR